VAYVLTELLGCTIAEGAEICATDEETFQADLIAARSMVRRRRTLRDLAAAADSEGAAAPDTVWERLVATMPSHLGSR
jgi:hypothetical protein